MKNLCYSICILLLSFSISHSANAQATLDLETGFVFPGYNDVRIPGNQGTLFSLNGNIKAKTTMYYRLRASYKIKNRHTISLLYAPLKIKSEGSNPNDILFEDRLFTNNTPINGTYKFNSYRLTYRYDIVNNPKFILGLGLTAKIRDASIGLSSANLTAKKTNFGVIPIINFRLWWKANSKFGLLLDGDALAAPQGRAEDVQIAGTYKISNQIGIRAGYRILEGGADNDEVYNFALFHYATVGLTYTFKQ